MRKERYMQRRPLVILGGALVLILVLGGVGLHSMASKSAPQSSSAGAALDGSRTAGAPVPVSPDAARPAAAPAAAPPRDQAASQAPAQVLPSLDRLIIRTVTLSLIVP